MEFQAIPGRQLESEVTLFSQGSLIKGDVTFDRMTRIHGRVEGRVFGLKGSVIVVGETASVHGEVEGDEVIIDGFVHGNVTAHTKVTISESGRLIGNVKSPKFEVKFGAHFEGRALTAPISKPVNPGGGNLQPSGARA
jgi:cytoskeletal protein CcmA (bactofilin family)